MAQEQVAEFAHQREEEASNLLQEVDAVLAGLQANDDPSILAVLQVLSLLMFDRVSRVLVSSNLQANKE